MASIIASIYGRAIFIAAFVAVVLYNSSLVKSEGCLNWSQWSDLEGVRNNFVMRHGEVYALSDNTNDADKCHLLNLDPIEGTMEHVKHDGLSVTLAGGMVCTIGITASVIATYLYLRSSRSPPSI